MTDERLDRRPVDESLLLAAACREPATQAASARVDAGDHPARVAESQLDVVRDDEATGLDADQPASQDVVAEQHLALASLEVREVQVLAGELDSPGSHLGDPVARDEEPATRDPADQSRHGRVAALGEAGDDIVHPSELSTRSVDEGASQDPGQCQPARLGSRLPGV